MYRWIYLTRVDLICRSDDSQKNLISKLKVTNTGVRIDCRLEHTHTTNNINQKEKKAHGYNYI
jgi:hypothetical protein